MTFPQGDTNIHIDTVAHEASPSTSYLLAIQRALQTANRRIAQATYVIAAILLVFLSVTLFLQVLFRYVIKQPLPWSEEAARFALVWYGMLSAAAGAWTGQHFVFRWATLILGDKARLILRLVVNVVTLNLVAVMIFLSWHYLTVFAGQTATATRLDMRIPFAGIPIGFSCFFFIYLIDLVDGLLALLTGVALSVREARETEIYVQLGAASHAKSSGNTEPAI
jgi:TRAP-type C4-dicarboxylate transport system permease small subunit